MPDLYNPRCAGAWCLSCDVCDRCGATCEEFCRDDSAYEAQSVKFKETASGTVDGLEGLNMTDLYNPVCAAVGPSDLKVCSRCGATRGDLCGDNDAFQAQIAKRATAKAPAQWTDCPAKASALSTSGPRP
jgi:hypothetical protein